MMLISICIIYKFKEILEPIGLKELAYFWRPNSILMFLLSTSIFGLFISIKMKEIKIINIIASTTLGIYMIHDSFLNGYIWKNIFKSKEHLDGSHPLFHILLATIIIFFFCAILDLIRQLLEKFTVKKFLYSKTGDKISGKITNFGNKILDIGG